MLCAKANNALVQALKKGRDCSHIAILVKPHTSIRKRNKVSKSLLYGVVIVENHSLGQVVEESVIDDIKSLGQVIEEDAS
jgi:hypothetical protein